MGRPPGDAAGRGRRAPRPPRTRRIHSRSARAAPLPHERAPAKGRPPRSLTQFEIPDVMLLRDDGKKVHLPAELDDGRPVVVNFIYTSCTTICPMNSQVFEQFQGDLAGEKASMHLISISIDPEQDTPAQ